MAGLASILDGVNSHFGGLTTAGRYRKVEPVEAFSLFSKITGGSRSYRGWNPGKQLIMVGISHLEYVDETLTARHVDALANGVEVKIVSILDGQKYRHGAA